MDKTIIVVDDEIGSLTLIGIMLEREGFNTLKARNAADALDLLASTPNPALIIVDTCMPGTDGIELINRIRSRPKTATTPILLLAPRGDVDSVLRGTKAGANDYMYKPVLPRDLVSKVRATLLEHQPS